MPLRQTAKPCPPGAQRPAAASPRARSSVSTSIWFSHSRGSWPPYGAATIGCAPTSGERPHVRQLESNAEACGLCPCAPSGDVRPSAVCTAGIQRRVDASSVTRPILIGLESRRPRPAASNGDGHRIPHRLPIVFPQASAGYFGCGRTPHSSPAPTPSVSPRVQTSRWRERTNVATPSTTCLPTMPRSYLVPSPPLSSSRRAQITCVSLSRPLHAVAVAFHMRQSPHNLSLLSPADAPPATAHQLTRHPLLAWYAPRDDASWPSALAAA